MDYSHIEDYEWDLGSDEDCELCGWSMNMLHLEFDNFHKDWRLWTSVGCYGGEQVAFGDDESAEQMLEAYMEFELMDISIKADILNKIARKEIEWGLI
jgi:hypothetical protein